MLSKLLAVSRTLRGELERSSFTVVAKLKAEINESFNCLKATFEAMWSLEEQRHQEKVDFDIAKGRIYDLEAELETKEAEQVKAEEEATTKQKEIA